MSTAIHCLCKNIAFQVQLDPALDHTQLQLCHCHNCRASTGLLCSSYYILPHEPSSLDGLRKYQESPYVSRFFCETCGAHILAQVEPSRKYLVASGTLVAGDAPRVQSIQHWMADDTGDGGLSKFLQGQRSTESVCRLAALSGVTSEVAIASKRNQFPEGNEPKSRKLLGRCHCGGVEFYITPPDASSVQAQSPWPDLLVPYHSGSSENRENVKWWLREGNTKYLAGTCACNSCRLGSGFPVQTWAFVPKSNIQEGADSSLSFSLRTMQRYHSSPGVYREFCSVCGATVFWHCDERPSLIDVSVGLLRGNDARAEDWLDWATGRVSFAELAVQKDLIQMLEELKIDSR